ncbi:Gfo/Idh/MocA family oxidoreductase [Microbacterium hydrothermale]|uniref:Gfo/Idh/MocA family oxidoreductase n=1 Tax=Microbacterium hydrothermale TaxID=857427 RepID=UPI0010A7D93C|nr:Gfo/Idh/MocA family oxidoreductase [Microbacterium hydrothermale]
MTSPTDATRVALVGFGGSARGIHTPLIRSVDGLELVAAVARSPQSAARAKDAGILSVDSIEALREHGVDLAVIATPDGAHREDVEAALEVGYDVVVEKPLAGTLGEVERLVTMAADAGRHLIPFHNRRWDGDFLTVRLLLAEDRVGDPFRFASRLTRWSPTARAWWRDTPRPGQVDGKLGDIGSHLVDQALVLFGPVDEVYAEVRSIRGTDTANDDCFLALQHRGGVLTHLHLSAVSAARLPRFVLQGRRAAFTVFGDDPQMEALNTGRSPRDAGWGRRNVDTHGILSGDGEDERIPTLAGDWSDFYRGVLALRRGDAAPPVAVEDAVAGLAVLEAAQRSAEDRCVIRIAADEQH